MRRISIIVLLMLVSAAPARGEVNAPSAFDPTVLVPAGVDEVIHDALTDIDSVVEGTDGWPPYKCYAGCGGAGVFSFAQCRGGGGGVQECAEEAGAVSTGCAILCIFAVARSSSPGVDQEPCLYGRSRG